MRNMNGKEGNILTKRTEKMEISRIYFKELLEEGKMVQEEDTQMKTNNNK